MVYLSATEFLFENRMQIKDEIENSFRFLQRLENQENSTRIKEF